MEPPRIRTSGELPKCCRGGWNQITPNYSAILFSSMMDLIPLRHLKTSGDLNKDWLISSLFLINLFVLTSFFVHSYQGTFSLIPLMMSLNIAKGLIIVSDFLMICFLQHWRIKIKAISNFPIWLHWKEFFCERILVLYPIESQNKSFGISAKGKLWNRYFQTFKFHIKIMKIFLKIEIN